MNELLTRIEALEKEVATLRAQLLELALRPTSVQYVPYIAPQVPQQPYYEPPPTYPYITCDGGQGRQNMQESGLRTTSGF